MNAEKQITAHFERNSIVEAIGDFCPGDSTLYFTAYAVNGPGDGWVVWKSDGSAAGTVPISLHHQTFYPYGLTWADGNLFFGDCNGGNQYALWWSNGTLASTAFVADVCPIHGTGNSETIGSTYYFVNGRDDYGALWKSDGSPAGTVRVRKFTDQSSTYMSCNLTNVNGKLFLTVGYPNGYGIRVNGLWKSDGTEAGTAQVVSIDTSDSTRSCLTNVNGTLYFFNLNDQFVQLWKTDGATTQMVLDIAKAANTSGNYVYCNYLTNINGTLYFAVSNQGKFELWKSNGTEVGTYKVAGFDSDITEMMAAADDRIFFTVFTNSGYNYYTHLWTSDGTSAGTIKLKSFEYWPIMKLVGAGNNVYFGAAEPSGDYGLYKSDGTVGGTVMVRHFANHGTIGLVDNLTNLNGLLYFSAGLDNGVWRSNGTEAGTVLVTPEQ